MYTLNFITEPESMNSLNLSDDLVDKNTLEKFGKNIKLIWYLYELKDEKVWERIQEDERNGVIYSEIYIQNLKTLTEIITVEFLSKLLNQKTHFDLKSLDHGSKYSLTFSLISDKKVTGARGQIWSNVNVMAFEHSNNTWTMVNDNYWNFKKWSVVEFKKGYCEIISVAQQGA